MRANLIVGILFIILGILSLGYGAFTYKTHDKVLDVGPLQATQEKTHTVALPPIVGVLCLATGVVVLVTGRRRLHA
jgi:hypothetical protein